MHVPGRISSTFQLENRNFDRRYAVFQEILMVKSAFSSILLKWNREKNNRVMPWKGESSPYRIWLSEIILQQTRVEQGIHYYNKFTRKYPTIKDLASASDEIVFKDWEGLGY